MFNYRKYERVSRVSLPSCPLSTTKHITILAPSITETEPIAQIPVTKKVEDVKSQPVIDKHEEHQYLDLIREILETGEHRPDRYS